jgi:hypothetical protein
MNGGSHQLRQYRIAKRDGATMYTACVQSGISLSEARLIDADDLRNPPGPECFEMPPNAPVRGGAETADIGLNAPISGRAGGVIPLTDTAPAQCVPTAPLKLEGKTMARTARKPKDTVEELKKPDVEAAIRTYREDIRQALSKVGEYSQELSTAYKHIKKHCRIAGWVAKLAFKLDGMEDAKRDVELRQLSALLAGLNIGLTPDLVDAAQGSEKVDIIPKMAAAARPELVSVN